MIIQQLVNDPNNIVKDKGTASSNNAVAITKTGVSKRRWILKSVQWSYAGGTVTGKLTITDGSTDIFEVDITATGPGGYTDLNIPVTAGANLVVTLGAGGSGVTGKLNTQTVLGD